MDRAGLGMQGWEPLPIEQGVLVIFRHRLMWTNSSHEPLKARCVDCQDDLKRNWRGFVDSRGSEVCPARQNEL